jgi:hypothetical protein
MAKIKKKVKVTQKKKIRIKTPETEKIKRQDRPKIEDDSPKIIDRLEKIEIPEKGLVLEELEIPEQVTNLEEDLANVPGSDTKKADYDSNKNPDYDVGPSTYQTQSSNDPTNKNKKYKRKEDQIY